ncbi:MAG: glycosyltransferase [Flavobacteriales bacterium]|jgi:glycosyltransferase involved in cell wall biosynthesis
MLKVSVVVTCYNLGAYLQEALESIDVSVHQAGVEVIVVDDGSTDPHTVEVLDSLDPLRYVVLRQANLGLAKARNNGIAVAKGDYIIPLDADNRLRPAMIDGTVAVLDTEPAIAIVYGDAEYFGELTGRWVVGEHDFAKLLLKNRIDACAGFRKRIWKQLGGYDEHMPHMGLEDWDFWLRASVAGIKFRYVPEIFFDYRVRKGSMLAGTINHMKPILDHIFNKPELAHLRNVRKAHLELLADKKRIVTGRELLWQLADRLKQRFKGSDHGAGRDSE